MRHIYALGLCAFGNNSTRSDQTFVPDRDAVVQSCVNPDEDIITDRARPRDHNMRRNKAVITDIGVMPHMVPTPQNSIVANRRKRLDRIIFENERVVTDC